MPLKMEKMYSYEDTPCTARLMSPVPECYIKYFRAQSISWNPHKMAGAPLQCSVFLVREKGLLHEANCASAQYLFQQDKYYDVSYDTGDKSIQCGRKVNKTLILCTFVYFLFVVNRLNVYNVLFLPDCLKESRVRFLQKKK